MFFSICFLSCNPNKKIDRENEPTIYNIQSDDSEMNQAIENAKQTLDSFDFALNNNTRIFTFFGLKKRVIENGFVEHIWIGNIKKLDNENYIGIVDNLPEKIENIKLGDTVQINRKEISDWMYIKNSKLHGGFSIKLLRDRMTKEERENFDRESGMKIE
ncbi:YegJ family protein [Flavobacterium haoranii]|uniref:YegJ family protein n=1 Tax=Flavobacterium haoranii TaxID=683124 RepID=UPI00187B16AD|nr:DUF2314 domain-containing protein [Flavobacterium haoranii]